VTEGAQIRTYCDLIVWQKAMELTAGCYQLAKTLPKAEEFRLTSQMLRAAASVPANIAEGNARGSRRDYARFVDIAHGSVAETETFLLLLNRVDLVKPEENRELLGLCSEIGRMLVALRNKLRAPPPV
jgi:four helix bundle protein